MNKSIILFVERGTGGDPRSVMISINSNFENDSVWWKREKLVGSLCLVVGEGGEII